MQDRFKFRIAVFERYNTDEWEFIKFIENTDKFGVSTNGNVIQENVQGYITHLTREKTPKNVYRTMEVIQSTGLKDKNGKLIYEGDILKENWHIYKLEWGNGAYTIKDIKRGTSYMFTSGLCIEKSEVIGNIYENPELLES